MRSRVTTELEIYKPDAYVLQARYVSLGTHPHRDI